MTNSTEYDARLRCEDLEEYLQYLLLERQENSQNETVKDTIAELQGLVLPGRLNGKTVIELREQNKVAADLAEQGKIKESVAIIQKILAIYPEHYSAFYTLGFISFGQENFVEALDCFKQAFDYNPFFSDALLRIFDCSICLGDTNDINELLSKALSLQPNDPDLLETKLHLESGTYPERLAKYIEVPDKEKSELKQELLKLKKMLESGNSEEALERLNKLF